MDPLTNFSTPANSNYQSSVNFDAYPATDTGNNSSYISLAVPDTSKDPAIQFTSVLAHEVRNPLTNINLSVELLGAEIKNNDLKIYLAIIRRSSIRINDLINELVKYQEAEVVQAEKHSIKDLLNEALEMAVDRILLKNISVLKDYAAEDWSIVLNKPKMKIALTNIIINAIDAMTRDKGQIKLVTRSIRGRFIIQIEDNGCGISAENLKNVFKPFFTNKPGGLGLGLATTYDILRSNHVGVNIESGEGEGTRFTLVFEKKQRGKLFSE